MTEVYDDMVGVFGKADADEYMRLMKATRSLLHIWEIFAATPEGSEVESVLAGELDRMLTGLQERPSHARAMIEVMMALIEHLRNGGTYEEWFGAIGLSTTPGEDGPAVEL